MFFTLQLLLSFKPQDEGKLATAADQIGHDHQLFRAYCKHAFLKQYEKFLTV